MKKLFTISRLMEDANFKPWHYKVMEDNEGSRKDFLSFYEISLYENWEPECEEKEESFLNGEIDSIYYFKFVGNTFYSKICISVSSYEDEIEKIEDERNKKIEWLNGLFEE